MTKTTHPKKISATQRQQLERLYDNARSSLFVTNRNSMNGIANSTAVALMRLGLVRFGGHMDELVRITEAGRARVQEWRTLATRAVKR